MSTPYSKPIQAFFKLIEKDPEFFNYYGINETQSMEIANFRAENYLKETVQEIAITCEPDIDFLDYDDTEKVFNTDWTDKEIYLVSNLMYEKHLNRDVVKLLKYDVNYTSSELRVFDPSNARNTFKEIVKNIHTENQILLNAYMSRDRLTGKLKSIDYASYDEDDE